MGTLYARNDEIDSFGICIRHSNKWGNVKIGIIFMDLEDHQANMILEKGLFYAVCKY